MERYENKIDNEKLFETVLFDIQESDIHYEYDTRGYMLYFKGKPIGGSGIGKEAKGCRANLKLFRQQAEFDKRQILTRKFNCYSSRYLKEIERIIKEGVEND